MSVWLRDENEINEILSCQNEGGEISTESVLERASQEDSAIHGYFEWDTGKAAREYNLIQARQLIRRVPVTYTNNKGEEKTVPRLINIRRVEGEKNMRSYMDISVVTADKVTKQAAINDALKEIRRWQNIYEAYDELTVIINEPAVEKLEKQYA